MARLGVFGGTFDPPHLGHLILASEALDQLSLERLLWVVTPDPPHKQGQPITALDDRLDLVQAAIAEEPAFVLSRVEVDRPGPHYALDTVNLLREQHPGFELVYLLGGDSLADLPDWHRPSEFVLACDAIGVMRRPGEIIDLSHLEDLLPGLGERVCFIDAPLLEISSSSLRRRAADGRPIRYYLSPAVFDLIQRRRLYRSSP